METFSDFGKIYYLKKIMSAVLCNLTPLIVYSQMISNLDIAMN